MDVVIEIITKSDMAKFTRAHMDGPIDWETHEGPGGTIVVVEHLPDPEPGKD